MATTSMFQNINNFIGEISEMFDDMRFNTTRANQPNPYKEIEFVARHFKTEFGCEVSNEWLDDVLIDRHGARSMITPKHRYAVPIYNPTLELSNQDEYVKRSELTSLMRTQEFKNFIDNLKCTVHIEL